MNTTTKILDIEYPTEGEPRVRGLIYAIDTQTKSVTVDDIAEATTLTAVLDHFRGKYQAVRVPEKQDWNTEIAPGYIVDYGDCLSPREIAEAVYEETSTVGPHDDPMGDWHGRNE